MVADSFYINGALLLMNMYLCSGLNSLPFIGSIPSEYNLSEITPELIRNFTTKRIKERLAKYDIRLRPGFGGDPLNLDVDVRIASFDKISEVNMDYTITMYLHQYWQDTRLSFSYDRNDSVTLAGDFVKQIWVPDTFLANDKESFLHDVTETNKMLRLHGDGYIAYGMRFTSTLSCNMNLRNYPMDQQECTVEIESYGYAKEDVQMQWSPEPVQGVENVTIPQFSIITFNTTIKDSTTSTGTYQRLSLSFKLQRNIGYFIFQTYLPCILIVMLSWVSFWINHEATSARVALGITTVLTMTTISTGVRSSLPRISYIKAIDIYLVMCFVFVFAALLEYAAVNYSYWGSRAKKKVKPRSQSPNNNPVTDSTWETNLGTECGISSLRSEDVESRDSSPPHVAGGDSLVGRMSPIICIRQSNQNAIASHCQPNPPDGSDTEMTGMSAVNYNTGSYSANEVNSRRSNIQAASSVASTGRFGLGTFGYRSTGRNLRHRRGVNRQRRVMQSIRQKARVLKTHVPKIKDINLIDRYSRVIFPGTFLIFNAFYWCYYVLQTA